MLRCAGGRLLRSSVVASTYVAVALIIDGGTAAHAQAIGDFTLKTGFTFSDRSPDAESVFRSRRLKAAGTVYLGPDWSIHGSSNVRVSMDQPVVGRQTGIGDTEVGVSGPLPSYHGIQAEFDYTIKLPTGDSRKGLSSGRTDQIATLTLSADVNDYLGVSTDVGDYLLSTADEGHRHYLFMAGVLSRSLDPDGKRKIELEVDYTPSEYGDPADLALFVTARIRVKRVNAKRQHTWTVIPSVSKGLLDSSSRWGASVLVVYSNARLPETELLLASTRSGPAMMLMR